MNENTCAICRQSFDVYGDSNEHVIPNSIGGRKKVRGFICRQCNSSCGQTWDAALAKQLNWFCQAIGIMRERGNGHPATVTTEKGMQLSLQADGTMTRKAPTFKETKTDGGGVRIQMFARTKPEAERMLRGIKEKYPHFDLEREIKSLKRTPFFVNDSARPQINLECPEAAKSLIKTALAQCFSLGISMQICKTGIDALNDPINGKTSCLYYSRDLVALRPNNILFHLVSVFGSSEKRILLAYVEYFSALRVLIKLSDAYVGEDIVSSYAIDPQTGSEINLTADLNFSPEELDDAFKAQSIAASKAAEVCATAINIATHTRVRRERQHIHLKEIAVALNKMGLQPGERPPPERREEFNRLIVEQLGSLDDYLNNIEQMPDIDD
jgi:hypothetical protein